MSKVVLLGNSDFFPSPETPSKLLCFPSRSIHSVSWSQVLLRNSTSTFELVGHPLPDTQSSKRLLKNEYNEIQSVLGSEEFLAFFTDSGDIIDLKETSQGVISGKKFSCVAMSGVGSILAVDSEIQFLVHLELRANMVNLICSENDSKLMYYFSSLSSPSYQIIRSPSRIDDISAGANHFLLLTTGEFLYSFGDNRFDQCGHSRPFSIIPLPSTSSSTPLNLVTEEKIQVEERDRILNPIEFFSGLSPLHISTGDLHSVVLTSDGSAYIFGKDHGSPSLINLLEGEDATEEEEPTIVRVACGSGHTMLLTREGDVWGSGLSRFISQ
jgi:alpha-tubulin suppressor-like RCC1 family protein